MEIALSIIAGVGLSAACGFRVFVPLLVMSIAANAGHLTLSPEFAWIGSLPALIAFAIATALEISGYYFPAVDNALDSIATPAAVVAGVIVTASMVTDMSPFLKWTVAVIAGGGAAATVQTATVIARGKSTVGTLGLANPLLATIELGGSLFTSLISLTVPLLLAVLLFAVMMVWWMRRRGVAADGARSRAVTGS